MTRGETVASLLRDELVMLYCDATGKSETLEERLFEIVIVPVAVLLDIHWYSVAASMDVTCAFINGASISSRHRRFLLHVLAKRENTPVSARRILLVLQDSPQNSNSKFRNNVKRNTLPKLK
jgi:hypothetical protein